MIPRPPTSTLFPYTTLFRSKTTQNQSDLSATFSHGCVRSIQQNHRPVIACTERNCCYYRLLIRRDRKSTRLNSSHSSISYAVFCLKKKKAGRKGRPLRDGQE